MNVLNATKETITLWKQTEIVSEEKKELSLTHAEEMLKRMELESFFYGKLCRWLGWIQAACVCSTEFTLEDMKNINERNKDDASK